VKPRISAVYRGDPRGTLVEPKGNKMAPTAKLPPSAFMRLLVRLSKHRWRVIAYPAGILGLLIETDALEFICWILLFAVIVWAMPWWLLWDLFGALSH
jgi:hypothetical protein